MNEVKTLGVSFFYPSLIVYGLGYTFFLLVLSRIGKFTFIFIINNYDLVFTLFYYNFNSVNKIKNHIFSIFILIYYNTFNNLIYFIDF